MNDKYILISDKNKQICDTLINLGYKLIYTESVDGFISYEKKHADIQCIRVEDKVFILKNCKNLFSEINNYFPCATLTESYAQVKYPNNILLNAKIIGKNIIGKIDSLDSSLVFFCKKNGYNFINVKQGYSGCSILKITDNSAITTDENIYRALLKTDIEVLKITQDGITLFDAKRGEQGLIGGASINLDKTVLFFGDIRNHPDYEKIRDFCCERSVIIKYIEGMPLTDIGGGVLLNF